MSGMRLRTIPWGGDIDESTTTCAPDSSLIAEKTRVR